MNATVFPGISGGTIDSIPSKSFAHRLLILAAFADRPCDIICTGSSDDIEATAECLRALGAGIEKNGGLFRITPVSSLPPSPELDCRESGSTYRFMLPVCAAKGTPAAFKLKGRLAERPMRPLFDILEQNGVTIERPSGDKVSISGALKGDRYTVRGDISSQFITGLMLAAPVMNRNITIDITGELSSSGYVDITAAALDCFGIKSSVLSTRIEVCGASGIKSPGTAEVEGDWSNAAFMIAACAAAGKDIEIKGLNRSSVQGDRRIVGILKSFGCSVTLTEDVLSVHTENLIPAYIDAENIPDLVPAIAVLACAAKGTSHIEGIARLKLKESDRIRSVSEGLGSLGADIMASDSSMTIKGTGILKGGTVDSFNDHRIVMMAAAASSLCGSPVLIKGAEAVSKSYPGFFEDAGLLGLKYHLEER